MHRLSKIGLLSLLALAACGDAAKPAVTPTSPAPEASAATEAPAASDAGAVEAQLPAGVPDSPAGHRLAWVLAAFARPPDEAAVVARFASAFTAQVPAPKIVELFAQLGTQLGPLAVDHAEIGVSPEELIAVVHPEKAGQNGPTLRIVIAVDTAEPHAIIGLTIRPNIETRPAASWDEVESGLRAIAPSVNFLAAEVNAGKCVALASIEPKKALALGSAFKLYVLYALAKQIAAGKHKWDDSIAIDDAKKGLPPGDMRKEPAGKTFTVKEFAEQMISVSDNTATDHLIAFVGRSAIEDAVKAAGTATPARDVPFLSTRDLFALKVLGSADELRAYAAADVVHKRRLLDAYEQRDMSQVPLDEHGWAKPRMIDSIEWFASPEDLCKLMALLKAQADTPVTSPLGAILSINPGIPDDKKTFKYVAFKGGSEPGVMNLTWLLQRQSDDKWVFLTVGFNDPVNLIDDAKAAAAAGTAREFLAK
jgi:beta-lactamase class A